MLLLSIIVWTFTLLLLPALIRCRLPKKCFKIRENQGIYWYYDWRRFKYVQTVILLVGINIILKDFKLRETRDITEMRAKPGSASKDFLVTTSRQRHFLFITSEICFFLQFPRLLSRVDVSFYNFYLEQLVITSLPSSINT